jgi:hypothetical protein
VIEDCYTVNEESKGPIGIIRIYKDFLSAIEVCFARIENRNKIMAGGKFARGIKIFISAVLWMVND